MNMRFLFAFFFAFSSSVYSQNIIDTTGVKSVSLIENESYTPLENTAIDDLVVTHNEKQLLDSTNKSAELPKITLGLTHSVVTIGGKLTSTTTISYFYVNDTTFHVGVFRKDILQYLEQNKKALKYYEKYKRRKIIAQVLLVPALGSFVTMAISVFAEEGDYAVYSAIVLVPSVISSMCFNTDADKNLKKSIKIYNENAGYGYVNGLEGKTKRK